MKLQLKGSELVDLLSSASVVECRDGGCTDRNLHAHRCFTREVLPDGLPQRFLLMTV
jgi:hypothetical protein